MTYLVFEKVDVNAWEPVRASRYRERNAVRNADSIYLQPGSTDSELATAQWQRSRLYEAGSQPAELLFRWNESMQRIEYHLVDGDDWALDLLDGKPVLRFWDASKGEWGTSELHASSVLYA